jgi:hypothetical protein
MWEGRPCIKKGLNKVEFGGRHTRPARTSVNLQSLCRSIVFEIDCVFEETTISLLRLPARRGWMRVLRN